MPFGLRNAAQTFQRFMDKVLRGLLFAYDYIDDILVASATEKEHLEHLHEVCRRLDANGIVINPKKCVLGVASLEFLGHQVDRQGIRPLEEKVKRHLSVPAAHISTRYASSLGWLTSTIGSSRVARVSYSLSTSSSLDPERVIAP